MALFHEGLGAPVKSYSTEIELGTIPYLNGGLFDEHALEKSYEIHIEDEAFENIFNFFDKWEWHLDTRHGSTGKEINPDVIGYIFEKYINDRADMGAYYTKEDITDYISKNSILTYLFDETERQYKDPFDESGPIWKMLKKSGDTYIYDAVKHGIPRDEQGEKDDVKNWKHTENWWESPVFEDLPGKIKSGLNPNQENLVDIRESWNISAPEEIALPTEIWREVIERRRRYVEIRQKIDSGEITRINDLITYNLNIRQFVQDAVETIDDPKFILHFYKSIAGDGKNRKPISVLDPTCGSGAFLFAALNILEPLYESCIMRMRAFVEDEDRLNSQNKDTFRHKYKFFRRVLKDIQSDYHPNQEYFVYKSIILRNLYGVDIMREAVEIAKLRLFLTMVATVDVDTSKVNLGLEPLPDIDFNIRAGNSLVGIGTEEEIDSLYDGFMDFDNSKNAVEEQCDMVSKAFNHYKQIQLTYGEDFESFKQAKKDLSSRLADLRNMLDVMLLNRHYPDNDLENWKENHQPFHWYAEFYDIIHDRGGFDVIIGNPPYLEKRQIEYTVIGLKTESSNAVHSMCIERSINILKEKSSISMIVPLALVCTQRMTQVQKMLEEHGSTWYSNFSWRPAKLFDKVNRALTIFIVNYDELKQNYSTGYTKWYSADRENLFYKVHYSKYNKPRKSFWFPKLSNGIEKSILSKIRSKNSSVTEFLADSEHKLYYRTTGGLYWKVFTDFAPKYFLNDEPGHSSRETSISVRGKNSNSIFVGLFTSNTFWWWYTITSNLRDLNPSDIYGFKFEKDLLECEDLLSLSQELIADLVGNSEMHQRIQKNKGKTETQSFKISKSKPIIDEIDKVLANHYKFSPEELDYIINYDIKYRMGSELED